MAELTTMKNIGKEIARKLCTVEIDAAEKLLELGSRKAFFRLKARYPKVCLVHLYALEGAVSGMEYNCLPSETKKSLKAFCDGILPKPLDAPCHRATDGRNRRRTDGLDRAKLSVFAEQGEAARWITRKIGQTRLGVSPT